MEKNCRHPLTASYHTTYLCRKDLQQGTTMAPTIKSEGRRSRSQACALLELTGRQDYLKTCKQWLCALYCIVRIIYATLMVITISSVL